MTFRKRVVLVGAGHAHLYTLRRAAAFVTRGHEVVLIAPDDFWYSGLATGMLGGSYPPDLDRIDVGALITRSGGRFICDRAVALDTAQQCVRLAGGGAIAYDVLSLNLGSEPAPIADERLWPERCFAAKPIRRLLDLRRAVERRLAAGGTPPPRIVVAGGGATAFELAANVLRLGEAAGFRLPLTMLAGKRPLAQLPPRAAEKIVAILRARGACVLRGVRVARVRPDDVITECGETHPYEIFVNATGLRPSTLARDAGLPVTPDGAMIVDAHLRSPADPLVHGGGDLVAFEGRPLPKAGVFAIRQAPILYANLMASLEGRAPRRFRPQRRYLWIMNLGDHTGLAVRETWWWRGRSAFWLKDWIDRRFLDQYG